MWVVPDFVVWGLAGWSEIEFLILEQVGSNKSALFGAVDIGDDAQQTVFNDLADHRGNQLPVSLAAPRVFVIPKSEKTAFIVGEESAEGFKIARDPETSAPVTVDLLIIEVGN